MQETTNEGYERWRKKLLLLNIALAGAAFLMELVISVILYINAEIIETMPLYILYYIVVPVGINIGAVLIEALFLRFYKGKENIQNMIPILALTLICLVVAYVHYTFSVTMIVFCMPIFLTMVFGDEKLCTLTVTLSELGLFLVAWHRNVVGSKESRGWLIPEVIIACLILILAGILAKISIRHLNEQREQLLKAQAEAEAANEAKSGFLANMSHEIRTPINTVIGMNEMILRESEEENTLDYAANIDTAAHALLGIVNDILDLTKIESGKMEIFPVEYDLSSMLHDEVKLFAERVEKKGLDFMVKVDSKLPSKLYGDDIRIREIITNLLSNAVKYTHMGKVLLAVNGKAEGDKLQLCVRVQDTGIGIKEEDIDKLFMPFERIEEARNRHIEGTGLGMNIVNRLLMLMGSSLQVRSEYGKGSTFSFTVEQGIADATPIGDLEAQFKRLDTRKAYHASFHAPNAKVLVVDDNAVNRKVFCGLLKETKIQVDEAVGGMECLEKTRKKRYDLLFLDHMMPGIDGIETFRRMKEDPENLCRDIPVVVLTANAISGAREGYLEAGFTDFLSKPIDAEKLEKMIARLLPEKLVEVNPEK